VGDGPERSSLQHQCDELGIAEKVRFAGFQARPASYYRAMDVFALTSRSEGLPLAVLEASACRLPVLASDVGGLSEIVEHQITGLLFPPESEEALTGSLVRLLDDAELRRNLGAAASHRVRQSFSAGRMGEHYRRHYLACLWAAGRSVANGDDEFDDDSHGLTHRERVSSY
jgi:glycosyltransferase involved in cell wall biosynthesis